MFTPAVLARLLPSMLLFSSVLLLFARWSLPIAPLPVGAIIARAPLALRARIRAQRLNFYCVAGLMLLGAIGGWLSWLAELILVVSVAIALFIPIKYTLTEEELALGRTQPRRWSAFRDVEVRRGRAVLLGMDGEDDMSVWLSGVAADDDRMVNLLRQRVKLAARASVRSRSRVVVAARRG